MNIEKNLTEDGIRDFLRSDRLSFPPLVLEKVETSQGGKNGPNLDALLEFRWGDGVYRFAVECRRLWTPKAIMSAVEEAKRNSRSSGCNSLVLVPYLSPEQLALLEEQGVSGLDLCGNGVVLVPGQLLVYRAGFPNRFRWDSSIKNVYRRSSSIVARVFLVTPEYASVSDVRAEILRRGGSVTLATVSKVCARMGDDLVIDRRRAEGKVTRQLQLLQPDKLLDLLSESYAPPEVRNTFTGKTALSAEGLREALGEWEKATGGRVALTGASSVEAYAVMAREPVQSFYCSDLASVLKRLGDDVREGERFANVTLLETKDDFVYFDRRPDLVASPIQTYLELAKGDKRDRETAVQVRRVILTALPETARTSRTNGPTAHESP